MEEVLVVSSVLLWIVVGFNLLLAFALVRRFNKLGADAAPGAAHERLQAGEPAPPFTAATLTARPVTLADYTGTGRETTFLFVSPTCGPCQEALPAYESLRTGAARAGVDLVLVSLADMAATQAMVDSHHLQLPVLVAPDSDSTFRRDYKVPATPSYVRVNAQGIVTAAGHPNAQAGEWQRMTVAWAPRVPHVGGLVPSEGR